MRVSTWVCDWCKDVSPEDSADPGLPLGWSKSGEEDICGVCTEKVNKAKAEVFAKVKKDRIAYGKLK